MSNEIQINVSGQINNGNFRRVLGPWTMSLTQAAVGATEGVVAVTTSEADLAVGSVSTPGLLMLTNLDSTNFVTYGPKSGGSMVAVGKIKPGETHLLRLDPAATLRWKADTATVKVDVKLYEN